MNTAPLSLHVSYLGSDLTIGDYSRLIEAFRLFGAQGQALAKKYEATNKPFSFFGIGGSYDPGKWFVIGEWGVISTDSAYGKRAAWYASSGYRIGKFTSLYFIR